jgi:hypothetical protein
LEFAVARERGEKYKKHSESSSLISPKENKILGPQGGGRQEATDKNKSKSWQFGQKTHILPVVVVSRLSSCCLTDTGFSQWVFLCLMGNQVRER